MSKKHRAPAPPAPKPDPFLGLLRLVGAAVLAIGAVTVATPLLRQVLHESERPAPGWVCWRVERSTAAGSERSTRCEPELGYHAEDFGFGPVVVPDRDWRWFARD